MQLVGKQIIQRNHPDNQEIGYLYYFFAKNLYNTTSCHLHHLQGKFIGLPVKIARKLQTLGNEYIFKLILKHHISIKQKYKNKFTNKLSNRYKLQKNRLPKIKANNRNKNVSTYLACTEINMKIKITEIFISFVIIDNLLHKHHGKLEIADKYRLVFVFWLWICKCKPWSYKVQLAEIENWLQKFFSSRFFRCYQNQSLASNYGKGFIKKFKLCLQKIITSLYKIGDKLLIHADINDSLNISIKLVPIAFS